LSGSLKRNLMQRGIPEAKLCRIPQGVDSRRFHSGNARQNQPGNILFVGRIQEEKGISELLTAFKKVVVTYPNLRMNIYGDSENRESIETMWDHHPQIYFHGHVDSNKMPGVFTTADIFVLPSYSEGLPNVVMEAMASGAAVIASRVGGIPELLEEGKCGILVTPGNAAEIETAIVTLIRDPQLRNTLTARARRRIENQYSLNKVKREFKELFDAI
ncbi:MAG: glycosyltransferase family 4 protein, partial [bacterium]|nr:glycosyltransferase family 4 protein [bacterium]